MNKLDSESTAVTEEQSVLRGHVQWTHIESESEDSCSYKDFPSLTSAAGLSSNINFTVKCVYVLKLSKIFTLKDRCIVNTLVKKKKGEKKYAWLYLIVVY